MTTALKKHGMPLSFTEFKEECNRRGYVDGVVDQKPQNVFAMRTKNKVKTEVKPSWYTVGYGRNEDELKLLREEMTVKGYNIIKVNHKCFNVAYESGVPIMERFWDIVSLVEDIDAIIGKTRGISRKVFPNEVAERNIFEKIAKRYRNAIENEDQDMLDVTRDLLGADKRDDLITIGRSMAYTEENAYREHVVPCIMIHNWAIEMTLNGGSLAEIAQMFKTNLAIVLISNEEQKLLDETLGWKTTMPKGWEFGDDPLARIKGANIKLI